MDRVPRHNAILQSCTTAESPEKTTDSDPLLLPLRLRSSGTYSLDDYIQSAQFHRSSTRAYGGLLRIISRARAGLISVILLDPNSHGRSRRVRIVHEPGTTYSKSFLQ